MLLTNNNHVMSRILVNICAIILVFSPVRIWLHPLHFDEGQLDRYGQCAIVMNLSLDGPFLTLLAKLPQMKL